jgi:hypothetical protein
MQINNVTQCSLRRFTNRKKPRRYKKCLAVATAPTNLSLFTGRLYFVRDEYGVKMDTCQAKTWPTISLQASVPIRTFQEMWGRLISSAVTQIHLSH